MFDFSIITPSYNMLYFLKMCVASIADQQDVTLEHIVIDGLSTDGTDDWLKSNSNIRSISEKDKGMYDAINKGCQMAIGNIIAYLNCDEQYLPGTLKFVKDFFRNNPDIDIIFGDALLVRPDGKLLSYRKGHQPRWYYILTSYLYTPSCTMFFRRKIVENGFLFDSKLRAVGDGEFVIRLLKNGYIAKHIKKYFSAFTITGKNMSTGINAINEKNKLFNEAPIYIRKMKILLNIIRLSEKVLSGAYFQKMPIKYDVYSHDIQFGRRTFVVKKASFKWPYSYS